MATPVLDITYPPELPVSQHREELLRAIRDHQVVVVAGETGSGKTTQLPKICLELGRGDGAMIAHTQPRRLAARTVAERIAEELRVPLGGAVGYSVRFNSRAGRDTRVRLMTDGLLLAEIQRDRQLKRYDTIIVDEAHERSLNIDFLLGYLAQLLPRRPDLKLIITSATIDPERFSRHFGDAPIVEVSGRTYPVEVRYREPPEETEQAEAVADAAEELLRDAGGDVLVFLSGEREIRDTAEVLRGRLGPKTDVLPLYARLASNEQLAIFKPHSRRRVVLATNVAETSLTVPGIRAVVDVGTARISRYSARLKVQRLPIEPVSQASADQRKGRCGRVADGICVRLYSEEDFLERPRFTDPEILRTNLASVILQMAALGLGAVERFPFLDPPDARQIRDGVRLLEELGAISVGGGSELKLTKVGRRLARLPVDPRLGRMVLAADELSCLDEVIVIAAALSIQDPRERPSDERGTADELHARFADETSDFMALLNLWRYLQEQQQALSGNQFRKRCKAEHLHYLRVREWQDLVEQLHQAARSVELTVNQQPGDVVHIHQALLTGLLSHVGLKDVARREYAGARGARFAIFPGSGLAKKQPDWVMVAELVETGRLWGRMCARIDPKWIEPLAGHLVKSTYTEPRWEAGRGSVVATERVTLYGLPIVGGRTVGYASIDPELSRELFIRRALVEGDWKQRHPFLAENRRRLEEVDELEARARRTDLRVDDEVLVRFFEERVPASVVSGAHFDRWWRDARRTEPDLLVLPRELLLRDDGSESGRPSFWKQGTLELPLSYRFEPGVVGDGVTVHVPLAVLGALKPTGFDWLVPALREELVVALIRGLPKELRRPLVPVPETAAAVAAALRPRKGLLRDQVAAELERAHGVRVPEWDLSKLPPHLRMTFQVEDADGAVLASGDDLDELKVQLASRLRADLTRATSSLERHGLREWPGGDLPERVELPGSGGMAAAYPALVDEGAAVGVSAFDTVAAQRTAQRAGLRRLLALTLPSPAKAVLDSLDGSQRLALASAPHGSADAVVADVADAALDALVAQGGGLVWTTDGWEQLRAFVAPRYAPAAQQLARYVVAVLNAARAAQGQIGNLPVSFQDVRLDASRQLGGLVYPGFVTASGAGRVADVLRYVQGISRRLERLPDHAAVDRDRMGVVQELTAQYEPRRADPAVADVRWMLEELRIGSFAQALGVKGQVSAKRIRRRLSES